MKKVLFLDGSWLGAISSLPIVSDRVEVTNEGYLDSSNKYVVTPNFLKMLEELTSKEFFDLIILGNNIEVGLKKAAVINKKQLPRVVVVANDRLLPQVQEAYEKIGISRFMRRRDLSEVLKTELGLE